MVISDALLGHPRRDTIFIIVPASSPGTSMHPNFKFTISLSSMLCVPSKIGSTHIYKRKGRPIEQEVVLVSLIAHNFAYIHWAGSYAREKSRLFFGPLHSVSHM